ncbi:hypothetical protein HK096_000750, partial [Nowakowskiella sp. JEL0078]
DLYRSVYLVLYHCNPSVYAQELLDYAGEHCPSVLLSVFYDNSNNLAVSAIMADGLRCADLFCTVVGGCAGCYGVVDKLDKA